MTDKIKEFVKERDAALRTLDIDVCIAFAKKWSPDRASVTREVAEIGMHKARTAALSLTKEERQFSKDWLTERGYKSLDDGDLT